MKSYSFKKNIPKNRKIQLELPKDAPTGKAELVLIVSQEEKPEAKRGMTGRDILNSKLMGMWKDRKDIVDSVEYARELRKRAEKRS